MDNLLMLFRLSSHYSNTGLEWRADIPKPVHHFSPPASPACASSGHSPTKTLTIPSSKLSSPIFHQGIARAWSRDHTLVARPLSTFPGQAHQVRGSRPAETPSFRTASRYFVLRCLQPDREVPIRKRRTLSDDSGARERDKDEPCPCLWCLSVIWYIAVKLGTRVIEAIPKHGRVL
jgi:hypothetical protein